MADVRGTMSPPLGTGQGAVSFWRTYVPGTTVPKAWQQDNVTTGNGTYSLTTFKNSDGSGNGRVGFTNSSGQVELYRFDWNSSGSVTRYPSPDNASPGLLTQIGIWLANGGSSTPILGPVSQAGPERTQDLISGLSWIQALGRLLSALVDPGFWKRVGIGAAGLLILILGAVTLYKKET